MGAKRLQISSLEVVRKPHPVAGPSGRIAKQRLVVRARCDRDQMGYGEAAPMPDYSPDSAAACERALASLNTRELVLDLRGPVLDQLRELSQSLQQTPAAAHGFQTAALDLIGQRLGRPIWKLLDPAGAGAPISLNALVYGGNEEEQRDCAQRAFDRGVRTFKLKVGRNPDADANILARLRADFGATVALRIDANGQWSVAQAREQLARLAAFDLEYVEEPVAAQNLAELGDTPVPVAFDESLAGASEAQLRMRFERHKVRAIVLKPSLQGGLTRCLDLAHLARQYGVAPVVTHMFGGAIAHCAAAHLAFALAPDLACGLDHHSGLQGWPPVLQAANGMLQIAETAGLGVAEFS